MSRSKRIAIIKDKSYGKSTYWRKIRSKINQLVRMGIEELPNEKTIVNDYDYKDWTYTPEFDTKADYRRFDNPEEQLKNDREKWRRK